MNSEQKVPSTLVSLLPLAVLVLLLFATIRLFGSDALSGGSQICLLFASGLCAFIGIVFYRVKWQTFEETIVSNIAGTSPALIILLLVGALSSVWMLSGVVPTLIYYGLQIIHPRFFLVTACIICAVVSVLTGSSWSTVATIGIALMGIGKAQGFADGWIAGAIISGAYFGDKNSPLSDTTVLASSVTGTPLFTHIRYMMYTTVPSFTIALLVFAAYGLTRGSVEPTTISLYTEALSERFNISLWLLLVPVLTGLMIARRLPAIVTLFLGALLGAVFLILFQPEIIEELTAGDELSHGMSVMKATLVSLYDGTSLPTSNAELTELISTRGMTGMMGTVWLILCAMCFGGAMTAGGMLESITRLFLRISRNLVSMVASTVGCGLFVNLTTSDQYMSIILTADMFRDMYRQKGYESRLLSRTTEDAVTVTSVLIPWNTCGLTQATVLGVHTIVYLPYCIFNIVSPIMTIIVAATGYKIFHHTEAEAETQA